MKICYVKSNSNNYKLDANSFSKICEVGWNKKFSKYKMPEYNSFNDRNCMLWKKKLSKENLNSKKKIHLKNNSISFQFHNESKSIF